MTGLHTFELGYLIEKGVAYPDNSGRFKVSSDEEAQQIITNLYVPLGFDESKLWFVFMVGDELKIFHKESQ